MKQYKLDIFEVLRQIDKGNSTFYDNLSENEQKAFVPLVTMRWLSGTPSTAQIEILNQFINPYVFSLYTHRALLFKLLTLARSNKSQRYKWIPAKKSGGSQPVTLKVICEYYKCSSRVGKQYIEIIEEEKILKMAELLGYQKEEITKLKTELKKAA